MLQAICYDAADQLENMRRQILELNAALRIDPGDIELPPYDIPRPVLTGEPREPLIGSRLPFDEPTSSCTPVNKVVLRRPLERGLFSMIVV